ncbi:MAG: acetyl-CoA carboxylase carboxyltransferase subunit alpha [Caulobacterales bacterium]|nr:acetyl-CoA carboxylase carboxyltransferase subunit alpha [Caulobacterales bacterium]
MSTAGTRTYLDFERPIAELESKIGELEALSDEEGGVDVEDEISRLKDKATEQLRATYERLDAWQKTQVARHPERPHFHDYRAALFSEYTELSGDRRYGDDKAIQGGLGRFRGRPAVVIGHEKGRDTEGRVHHNFGMARPEGYRKAIRLMDLAERFQLPVFTFVDTPGAYPGVGAEERGQAEAIARAIERCLTLPTPLISVITGEGGSGGAIAIAAANRVLMLEHSVYSVISPEGGASILWRDSARAKDAAVAMRIAARDLHSMRIVDEVVMEPAGGAHRWRDETLSAVGDAIELALDGLSGLDAEAVIEQRRERFLAIGREGLA